MNSAGLVALLAGITAFITAAISGITGWLRQHHQGKTEEKTSALQEIDTAWRINKEAIARLEQDVAALSEKVRDTEESLGRQAMKIRQLERENSGLREENARLRIQIARLERPEGV